MDGTPNKFKIMILAIIAVAYLAWPLDLIPDAIPILGQADDLIVGLLAASGMKGSW